VSPGAAPATGKGGSPFDAWKHSHASVEAAAAVVRWIPWQFPAMLSRFGFRAVGKLCVVPAGALPVPVSDRLKCLYGPKSPIFLRPKAGFTAGQGVLLPSQAGSTTASHQPGLGCCSLCG
jgi:hypothetical protein